jgi:mRNA interferase YafQ
VGCRDLHIEPDWILIYTASAEHLRLERTGTHSDLFR